MELIRKHLLFASAAAGVIAADQALKLLVLRVIPLYESIEIIPGFFSIVHYRNPGGAFGMFASNSGVLLSAAFLAVTLGALGLIIYLYLRTPRENRLLLAGLALLFGGAAGNLIDRLRLGNVVDFIDVYAGDYHWPAFNLADSAITIGVVIFAGCVLFNKGPY
ncbi:MAG: signal peptidase II [Desulfobacterales bacterium]